MRVTRGHAGQGLEIATRELKQQPEELETETDGLDSIFRGNSAHVLRLSKLSNPRELEMACARVLKIAFIATLELCY